MSSSNIFKRKIYSRMLEWKKRDGATALLIEGARRIGKSTIVEEFGKNEFIYRIQWHSNFYTVNKHESTSYNSHNAQVILPVSEFSYYLNVPQW